MNQPEILSTFTHTTRRAPAPVAPVLVFDACRLGVMLRALLFVEAVLAVVLMFQAGSALDWLFQLALVSGGALPGTLAWLILGCSLKRVLARWPLAGQYAAGIALGALAGLYAWGMLTLSGLTLRPGLWLGSAAAGALLSSVIVAGLVWRVRGRTPAATQARLAELQSRIRPHFLFNALNSAIALVREEPARAERILEDLSELFRHALAEPGDSATLGQEIELARRYLDIEQVRFGDRLRVQWLLDERVEAARLPPLILQPLVENAVKHGVEPSADGADVRITTQLRAPMALIEVRNTVPAGQGRAGQGIALANVRDRLKLLHDVEGSFHTALSDGMYLARIQVPLQPPAEPAP